MNKLVLSIILTLSFSKAWAHMVPQFDDSYMVRQNNDYKAVAYDEEVKMAGLEKNFAHMQKSYEDKINFLETELEKTKSRLVEKSINEEKIQLAIKEHYEEEVNFLKKELISKTRTVLEYQRQIEKINPSEDTKHLIQINTDLAAELRKSEGQLAVIELEYKKMQPNTLLPKTGRNKERMPASVEDKTK